MTIDEQIEKKQPINLLGKSIDCSKYLEEITPETFKLMRQYQACYKSLTFVQLVKEYQIMREYVGDKDTICRYYNMLIDMYNHKDDIR